MARRDTLPGRTLTLSISVGALLLLILVPLTTIAMTAAHLAPGRLLAAVASPRAVASYELSFGASLAAAALNAPLGLLFAWVLVRYRFPGRRLLDALIDLPFAIPTAVSGIALTAVWAQTGWLGSPLATLGVPVAFTALGVTIALTFIGLPFVVRSIIPVIEVLGREPEEAGAVLGATRWQTVVRVTLPTLWPAVLTGVALALARG